MPSVPTPAALKQQLATAERCIYALWHREEPPSRTVVEKFARKLGRYPVDRQQRQLKRRGFDTQALAGSVAMPDPQLDDAAAVAYLRNALADVDDVVVFYSDLLGNEDDPVGRRTGRELEFVCGDPLLQPKLRFWFGRVHEIDTDMGQIGKCALNSIAWTFLPEAGTKFSIRDPDVALDSEVARSIEALLGKVAVADVAPPPPAAPPAAPPAPPPPAPPPAQPATGWLQRLFGRRS